MSDSRLAAMRRVRPTALAMIAVVLVTVLSSCGGSSEKLIPPQNAALLTAALNQVQDQANAGNCDTAAAATDQVQRQIEALPATVDARLKEALVRGTDTLRQLTENPDACQAPRTTPTQTTETTQTTQTQTETTPTETTPTETTPTEPGNGGTPSGGTPPSGGAGGTP